MNYTDQLVNLIIKLQSEKLPSAVVDAIKYDLIDYLGVYFAGRHFLKEKINRYLSSSHYTKNAEQFAFVNGLSSHFLEMDDGNRFGMVHPGSVVLSALFAIAKCKHIDAKIFIQSVFVGYEITIRLASAIQPSHKKRGFHATGTCGAIGAAAAVSTMLSIDNKYLKSIISAATASACGLLEVINDSSELKPYNVGMAAKNGINAVYVGSSGFSGPDDCIGGKRGLLGSMADSFDSSWLDFEKHGKYTMLTTYKKPFASCRHCHSAIEAALILNNQYTFSAKDISGINIETYDLAVFGHDNTLINNSSAAKMSIPYSVAAALVFNDGGILSYNEAAINNNEVASLLKKITVEENSVFSKLVPEKRAAKVTIRLENGSVLEKIVEYPKGEPENPMSCAEIKDKYYQMMNCANIEKNKSERILDCAINLENKLDELLTIL